MDCQHMLLTYAAPFVVKVWQAMRYTAISATSCVDNDKLPREEHFSSVKVLRSAAIQSQNLAIDPFRLIGG